MNLLKMIVMSTLIVLTIFGTAFSQVLINEFLASNLTSNSETFDYSDYSDWIELYNPEDYDVVLNNSFLTDNNNFPLKWRIPDGTVINARGFLLIWADGYDNIPGSLQTRPYWPFDEFTTVGYHTNFKLSSLGEEIALYRVENETETIIISMGSTWNYLDVGMPLDTAWRYTEYDDDMWKSGPAPLGRGNNDEATLVDLGSGGNRHTTIYFRKSFTIDNPSDLPRLLITLQRDDGAVGYLNGSEIFRSNMPEGEINYYTKSFSWVPDTAESYFYEYQISGKYLTEGVNMLAVEVHQFTVNSSDLRFEMEMKGMSYSGITLLDSVVFGNQSTDVSYGRNPDNLFEWKYFASPTPGETNSGATITTTSKSEAVIFSAESGFYQSPMEIQLDAISADAVIRYTIDGSTPAMNSPVYSEPISIDENTVVKAKTFVPDYIPGPTTTHTYFINEHDYDLPVVSFSADPLTLWNDDFGIYENSLKQREIPANIEYFNIEGDSEFKLDAGARIGGMNIWRFAQKPLLVIASGDYGSDFINYQLFDSKSVGTFKSIVLRNGGDTWNTSMLPDAMTEAILDGQMQNGSQSYKPCVVFLNGSYWGIHNIRDRFDAEYFTSNFGVISGSLDHLEYAYTAGGISQQIVEGSSADYNSMINYVLHYDPEDDAQYQYLISQMDMDSFIDFIAIEVYVANRSWGHNREWWRSNSGDRKWRWLVSDLDRGFLLEKLDVDYLPVLIENYDLFNRLLLNEKFRNRFIQRFAAHINWTFHPDRIRNIVDSLANAVASEIPRHIERWQNSNGIQSIDSYNNELNALRQFAAQRGDYLFEHISVNFSLNELFTLNIESNDANAGSFYINDVPLCMQVKSGAYFRDIPLTIKAVPKPGYAFAGWEEISNLAEIQLELTEDTTLKANFTQSELSLVPADIWGDITLGLNDSDYQSTGDITVHLGASLTIEKGVRLAMHSQASIIVEGNLSICGTVEEPVIIYPDTTRGVQKWGAICFRNVSDTCRISNLFITDATIGPDAVKEKAAISAHNSNLIIENMTMEEVGFPIFISRGSTILRNSSIRTDVTCDFINIKYGKALVENCTFYGNIAPDTDAIDYDGVVNGIITGNRFYDFKGLNCDAIDLGEQSQNILITDNKIYNSSDKGISVGQKSSADIIDNLIVNCYFGIAVKDSSQAYIRNNTFVNNQYSVVCTEKNYNMGGGNAVIVNSIFSHSAKADVIKDAKSSVEVSYCLSDVADLAGPDNLFTAPVFNNPANYNFEILDHSPCLNSGDPDSNLDSNATRPDIGADYTFDPDDYPYVDHKVDKIIINEINFNNSDSTNSGDWIELYNQSDSTFNISGWIFKDQIDLHSFTIPLGTVIEYNGYLIICRDEEAFNFIHPSVNNYLSELGFGLDNSGEELRLFDDIGELMNELVFDNKAPWPERNRENINSLELTNPNLNNNLPENWSLSLHSKGSPGMENPNAIIVQPVPEQFSLLQNYPNPFNASTTINFELPAVGRVKLSIFDIMGRERKILLDERLESGYYSVEFNARDMSSGVYFYRIEVSDLVENRKMLLLK